MHDHTESRCERCGERVGTGFFPDYNGELQEWTFRCLCDGIVCRYCKRNAIHRPISNYFNDEIGAPRHVPFFGNLFPCGECRAKGVTGKGRLFRTHGTGDIPILVAGDASGPPAWATSAAVCDQCGWVRRDDGACLCAGWVCNTCGRRAIPRAAETCSECLAVGGAGET